MNNGYSRWWRQTDGKAKHEHLGNRRDILAHAYRLSGEGRKRVRSRKVTARYLISLGGGPLGLTRIQAGTEMGAGPLGKGIIIPGNLIGVTKAAIDWMRFNVSQIANPKLLAVLERALAAKGT